MSSVLRISEAAVLALHSMAYLAITPDKLSSTKEIATKLRISEAHLSKVLQRLSKTGLVKSIRGPRGGFVLGKASEEISLLEIYESIDGQLVPSKCLFGDPFYSADKCILGGLLGAIDDQVRDYLVKTKLNTLNCQGRCYDRQLSSTVKS